MSDAFDIVEALGQALDARETYLRLCESSSAAEYRNIYHKRAKKFLRRLIDVLGLEYDEGYPTACIGMESGDL